MYFNKTVMFSVLILVLSLIGYLISTVSAVIKNPEIDQKFLTQIQLEKKIILNKTQITIALIDTGVDINHTSLKKYIVNGKNIINPQAQPIDDNGHGTNSAGIISSIAEYSGAFNIIKIMPIKALDRSALGEPETIANAIRKSVDEHVQIISLSLGLFYNNAAIKQAIDYAEENKVLIIAPTGNDGGETLYPALYPTVLAVGGVDEQNLPDKNSNSGSIDIVAPDNVFTTKMGGGFVSVKGTSMSAPQASTIAAIMLNKHPELEPYQIRNLFRKTAIHSSQLWNEKIGYGLLNAKEIINSDISFYDIYKPNNLKSAAKNIGFNKFIYAQLENELDQGWFSLESIYDGYVELDASILNHKNSDLIITIWNKEDEQKYKISPNSSSIQFNIKKGENIFMVSSESKETINYKLIPYFKIYKDKFEPNNSQNSSYPLEFNQLIIGTFDVSNDIDWYMIHNDQIQQSIGLSVKTKTNKIDPIVAFYKDINQSPINIDLSGFGGSEDWTSPLLDEGNYYISISNNHQNAVNGEYELIVTKMGQSQKSSD